MLNRVILIGRLTRDPELRYVPSGQPVASFTLAVDRPFTNQQGERGTDFIDVVAWRRLADQAAQFLKKGRMVAVEGRLQIRSYETQDGQKRKAAEVVATDIRFLDRKGAAESPGPGAGTVEPAGGEEGEEDVPF
ncbi:MAG: single-stranded DNA-binding protein [Armatimonadetes bacterium]|nr:single-stranded DNA-binding protein [Armatimonadota bacterium]